MSSELGLFLFQVTDVSHQPLVFRTLHGRAFEEAAIVLDRELTPLVECHLKQFFFGLQFRRGVWLCKSVPGTRLLTAVATVEAIAHRRLCFLAELTFVLNSLVRETAVSVELTLLKQGVRRTGIDAATTNAAAVRHRIVGRKLYVEEELTKKKHASAMWDDELMVLSHPSESRLHGPVTLKDGSAVDEDAIMWRRYRLLAIEANLFRHDPGSQ